MWLRSRLVRFTRWLYGVRVYSRVSYVWRVLISLFLVITGINVASSLPVAVRGYGFGVAWVGLVLVCSVWCSLDEDPGWIYEMD